MSETVHKSLVDWDFLPSEENNILDHSVLAVVL